MSKKIKFYIDHIDPLGQGVSKKSDKVTFIPKTLPGEVGMAQVTYEKSKIQFASALSFETESPSRINPECPHYQACNGCHFLHTGHEEELKIKVETFRWLLKKILRDNQGNTHGNIQGNKENKDYKNLNETNNIQIPIQVIKSPTRFETRNRIQLHYNKKEKKLGLKKAKSSSILEVPNCLLPSKNIQKEVSKLYEKQSWFNIAKKQKGHIEVYEKEDQQLSVAVDMPYAHLGFSQVNSKINEQLIKIIKEKFILFFNTHDHLKIVDLFGGSGNLSKEIAKANKSNKLFVVDKYINKRRLEKNQIPIELDLFSLDAAENFNTLIKPNIDLLIIDPPRSGFKDIKQFISHLRPKFIFYVSCNPDSLARDLEKIQNEYKVHELFLLDMFPGTFRFESFVILKKI